MARRREEFETVVEASDLSPGDHISIPGSKVLAQSSEDSVTLEVGTVEPMGPNHLRVTVLPSEMVVYFKTDELVAKVTHYRQAELF